jgi:short-subunit dehydrogenase
MSSYCATKFAVRAVSEALGAELAGTNVGVTTVLPGVLRTNLVSGGHFSSEDVRRQLDRRVNRFAPSPERTARKIVRAIERHKRRVVVCADAHLMEWCQRLFPVLTQRLIAETHRRRGGIEEDRESRRAR